MILNLKITKIKTVLMKKSVEGGRERIAVVAAAVSVAVPAEIEVGLII